MAIIGIDLGTTNSLVACYKDGESILIPNEFGDILTPSVVHVNENREVLVGKAAKELLIVDPDNTISVFKRSMGLDKMYRLRGKNYRPEELSAFVIKQLVEDAKKELQEEIDEVIISVPAYFDDMRRKATKRAGEIAGVRVERLINEPSAAALACRMEDDGDDNVYLVFDFGGGTLDVSVVECFDNVISVNAVSGDNHLGGSDFDQVIAEYICNQFNMKFSMLRKETQSIVLRKAEQLKMKLSVEKEAFTDIQTDEVTGEVSIDHDKLVEISAKIFNRMKKPVRQVLNDSDFGVDDISKIIMVGGSSKMTVVGMYLYYLLGVDMFVSENADETVAKGLGYYAGMKERQMDIKEMVLTDICPFSLGIDIVNRSNYMNPYFKPIIERNSVLPISKTEYLTTAHNFQTELEMNIYQGDESYAKDNILLDTITANVKPKKAGEEMVEIRFTYDINGILDVDVLVQSTKARYQKTIVNKNLHLSKQDIQLQLKKMEELKLDPRKKAKNQYVISYANALYRQTSKSVREYIEGLMRYFDKVLASANEQKIEYVRKRLLVVLSNLEAGLYDFSVDEEMLEEEEYEEERDFINSFKQAEMESEDMTEEDKTIETDDLDIEEDE